MLRPSVASGPCEYIQKEVNWEFLTSLCSSCPLFILISAFFKRKFIQEEILLDTCLNQKEFMSCNWKEIGRAEITNLYIYIYIVRGKIYISGIPSFSSFLVLLCLVLSHGGFPYMVAPSISRPASSQAQVQQKNNSFSRVGTKVLNLIHIRLNWVIHLSPANYCSQLHALLELASPMSVI